METKEAAPPAEGRWKRVALQLAWGQDAVLFRDAREKSQAGIEGEVQGGT